MSSIATKVTPRQYEVLRLIKHDGLSTPEVAEELEISFSAARGEVRNLRNGGFLRTFSGRGRRPVVTVDLRTVRPRLTS